MPYLLQEPLVAHREGTPMLRALFLEFLDDMNVYSIDTQYMLGSNLLVAPIFDKHGAVTYYVPRDAKGGHWRSWFDRPKT